MNAPGLLAGRFCLRPTNSKGSTRERKVRRDWALLAICHQQDGRLAGTFL